MRCAQAPVAAVSVDGRFEALFGFRRGAGRPDYQRPLYHKVEGVVESFLAYPGGPLHREDGPARIETAADGTRVESWYCDGCLHREDGPAVTITFPDGGQTTEDWCEGRLCVRREAVRNSLRREALGF